MRAAPEILCGGDAATGFDLDAHIEHGHLRAGDAVLFKASRGVRLERALTLLLAP